MNYLKQYSLEVLLEMLAHHTAVCNKMFKEGDFDKEYHACKMMVDRLVTEIMKRNDIGLASDTKNH